MNIMIYKNNRPDIEDAIRENGGYCCCAITKTDDTKCMCKDFRDLPEGECNCGLYRKVRNEQSQTM